MGPGLKAQIKLNTSEIARLSDLLGRRPASAQLGFERTRRELGQPMPPEIPPSPEIVALEARAASQEAALTSLRLRFKQIEAENRSLRTDLATARRALLDAIPEDRGRDVDDLQSGLEEVRADLRAAALQDARAVLNLTEAAQLLRMKESTVSRYAREGRLRHHRLGGQATGRLRFRRDHLLQDLDKGFPVRR